MGTPPSAYFNASVGWELRRQWRKLSKGERPKDPVALLRLLRDSHEYPHEEAYSTTPRVIFEDSRKIKAAYDNFRRSAQTLSEQLGGLSAHYFLLGPPLFYELSVDELRTLRKFERSLPGLINLPELTLLPGNKPREDDPYRRAIALAVCFYVKHVERRKIRSTFHSDGEPLSREGRLLQSTYAGLGVHAKRGLEHHLRMARDLVNSEENPVTAWEIFQAVGLAIGAKN